MIANNHLHKDIKPVLWCSDCKSALAEAEAEYEQKVSPSIDVMFKAADSQALGKLFNIDTKEPIYTAIWTTTPWTIPANRALAVHAKLNYSLIEIQDTKYSSNKFYLILAEELVESCIGKYQLATTKVLSSITGDQLELQKFHHPLYDFTVPMVLADYVSTEAGTGIVHTAGGHGLDDFNTCKKYKLEVINLLKDDGTYKNQVENYPDLSLKEANNAVTQDLITNKALLNQEDYHHSYPHCWRHKTPIIFRATSQWFISMDGNNLRQTALTGAADTKWMPSWGEDRISNMLKDRQDWCISRQRTWGVPIAIFVHKETEQIHPDTNKIIEQVATMIEKEGIQAWFDLEPQDILGADADQYLKVNDILDVWFDAGSSFYSVVEQRPEFKGNKPDIYIEGSDQHRGWFMSSLMLSSGLNNKPPYKQVITHGFTVDQKGQKMSKSIGNIVTPQDIIKKFGADVLRIWIASTNYTLEMSVSDEIITRNVDVYRKIRNTARFMLANLNEFNHSKLIPPTEMVELDKWILLKTKELQAEIIAHYEAYNFHTVIKKIMNFCSVELGSFYLDIIKDRQYTASKNGKARLSCQTALYHIIQCLVRWIMPIASFTAHEIWNHLKEINPEQTEFIFTETWYTQIPDIKLEVKQELWTQMIKLKEQANKAIEEARNDNIIGSSLEAELEILLDKNNIKNVEQINKELKFIMIASKVTIIELKQGGNVNFKETNIDGVMIKVNKSKQPKCDRCWHHCATVNTNKEHAEICSRCIENTTHEQGEHRKYA